MNEWESDSPVPAIGSQSGSPSAPAVDPSLYTPPMARPIPFVQHSPEPTARRGDPLLADPPQSAAGGSVYAHWLARQTPSAPLPPNSATSAAPIQ